MVYQCAVCGETHDDLPDIGFRWPDYYFEVPESERDERIKGTTDTCVIDDKYFFIRCVLLIPVHDYQQDLGLGVWLSQSEENFGTYLANFDSSDIGPFFGWFGNSLPFYKEDTGSLKARARFQGNNQRPLVELEPTDHPLVQDCTNGISLDRAWKYVHWYEDGGANSL